jgi:hypothetical protein
MGAVAAAVAPGIPIIDAGTGASPSIEGPAQQARIFPIAQIPDI